MKLPSGLLILPLLLLPLDICGQVDFIKVDSPDEMNAAQKKASDQMLMLFVDVYADWCGPCKMMDSEVFANATVSDYMRDHYLGVKVDGESDFGRIFAAEQGLEGYPSMFVFSDDGELISRIVGYTPVEEMMSTLRSIKEGFGRIKTYRARYLSGNLEPGEFADYITVIRNLGKEEEAAKLSEEYMEKVMGPKLADSDILVVAYHMDLDDTWWEDFSSDEKRLKRILGDDYMLAMEKIYNNSLMKAVEEERIDLISKMAYELAPLVDREAVSWDLRSLPFIQFYYYSGMNTELISYVDQRFASDRKDDHRWLFEAASQITDMDQQYLTEELLLKELQWYKACIELEEHYDYFFYQGMAYFFLRDQGNARESFQRAGALAETQEQKAMVEQVLGYINTR